jgi:hypothetical protein
MARRDDVIALGDLLNLGDRERQFWDLFYVRKLSIQQISDQLALSYSRVAHISSHISQMLAQIDL